MAYRVERYRDPGLHDGVQLYVKHIPLEFDENYLYELFSEYGEVANVHIPERAYILGREYLFGYVSYLTTDEALHAISALNGKAPYYISVEVSRQAAVELSRQVAVELSRQAAVELLRDQTRTLYSSPKCTGEVVPTFRRHSSIGCNYKLTTTPDGKRVVQGIHSEEPRRSVPFGDRNSAVARDLFEEDDVPAPRQKQKFPCYECGNLTFRKCVCGGAYYCKDACRMSDWPKHKQDCIKKLESQPDFQAGAMTGVLQNRSINIEKSHLSSSHLETESFNNRMVQLENGLQSEQKKNHSHNLSHRQPRFPVMNDFTDSQIEVTGVRNDGKRQPRFQICDLDIENEMSVDKKENSNKGSLNDDVKKDGDNRRNFNQRDGDNRRNFDQHNGDRTNFNQRVGDNRRNFDQCDSDKRRNFNQYDGDNRRNFNQRDGENRRNFNQRDGENRRNFNQRNDDNRGNCNQRDADNRRNFNQRDADNRRNFNQRDADNRRNFIQRVGDNRRNFIQRDGDNRRNFNQHDGNTNKFGDGNARKNFVAHDQKSFSGRLNEKKCNGWKGKCSEESVPTNNKESEKCLDQLEEDVPKKVEEKQDKLLDKHGKIQDIVVEADDKTSHLAVPSSENSSGQVAKVMVVMKEGPKTYFVQRMANNEILKIICKEIINSPSLPLVKPKVGMLCAAMFEGEWYRARVLMLDPQLAVQYVDYGNVEICDPTTLHELPQSIADLPLMAEKVEFDDKTPAEVCTGLSDGAIISIKLSGKMENGAVKVTMDNRNNAVLYTSASPSQDDSAKDLQHISTPSIQAEETPFPDVSPAANVSTPSSSHADTIQPVDSAVETESKLSVAIKAVVIMKEGPKIYFIQQLANNDKLKLICDEVVKSPSLPLVKPEVGMLCAAMFEGEWYRARVMLLDPQLAVQYVDYGNIDICDPVTLHELPQSIVDFPPMAEKIELVDETQELSAGCIISVIPAGEAENGVMKVRFDDGKKAFSTHVASSVSPQSDTTAKECQQASAASAQVSTLKAETSKSVVTPSHADNLPPVTTLLQVVCVSSASVDVPDEVAYTASPSVDVSKEEKAFAKAKITVFNDSIDYWVTWECNLETVDKIILKTYENITTTPLENPKVGLLCVAKFDGIWFRARIVKISPEVQVHYLDYGNYEICTETDLRDLPETVKDFPPMAFRVRLAEGTPPEYYNLLPEDYLSIRVVAQGEAGVSIVQVEGVKYAGGATADMLTAATKSVPYPVPSYSQEHVTSIPSETNSQVEMPTIPKFPHCEPSANSSANLPENRINASKFYDVRVAVMVGDKDYWVQRVNRDKELQFVMVQVNDCASKCIRMTPEVGKLCATEFLGLWYRARITKVTPEIEVHFVDFGNTEVRKKDEILELPESVQEVAPLALRIQLADGTPAKFTNLQVDSIISVKPFLKTSDGMVIVLVEGVKYAMDSEETTSQADTSTVCASVDKQPEEGSSKTEQVFTLK